MQTAPRYVQATEQQERTRSMILATSMQITKRVQAGMAVDVAVDAVLGAGTFATLAGDLYDTLRAR